MQQVSSILLTGIVCFVSIAKYPEYLLKEDIEYGN